MSEKFPQSGGNNEGLPDLAKVREYLANELDRAKQDEQEGTPAEPSVEEATAHLDAFDQGDYKTVLEYLKTNILDVENYSNPGYNDNPSKPDDPVNEWSYEQNEQLSGFIKALEKQLEG